MENEYYGVATTPTDDYLAHYGVKGMKWGVRKALERGNTKALGRQYRKAQKKLMKLEKRANNGAKYARRAAALGAGAAAAGGLAAVGTRGVDRLLKNTGRVARQGMAGVGSGLNAASKFMGAHGIRGAGKVGVAGQAVTKAGRAVGSATYGAGTAVNKWGRGRHDVATAIENISSKYGHGDAGKGIASKLREHGAGSVSNNTLARAGAAAAGLGLGIGAGYNAYRAATTKRAAKKAAAFRQEMNKAFAGTAYANGAPRHNGKKRRRG